jgi:hypothetical protein
MVSSYGLCRYNASGEPPPEAGAEWTRLAVGSSAGFGGGWPGLGPGMRLPQGLAGAAHADEEVRTLAVAKR